MPHGLIPTIASFGTSRPLSGDTPPIARSSLRPTQRFGRSRLYLDLIITAGLCCAMALCRARPTIDIA
jgi:hypothetical protein